MSPVQKKLVDFELPEISEMLTKGAISLVYENQEKNFLSNLLLVGKQDGSYQPVLNLNKFNRHIP